MTLSSIEMDVESRLQPSPTLAAAEMVRKLQSDGKPVFRFDIGEPDFDSPKHINEAAIEAIRNGFTHYTSAKGIPELRAAIAQSYVARGIPVKPENVAIFPGSKLALYGVLSLIINPGNEAIIQDPSWPTYASMISFLRGSPIFAQATFDQHFVPTINAFQEKITDRTKVVLVNSPGNPTGVVYPQRLMDGLRELLEKRNIVFISDEIYSALVYNTQQAPSPLQDPESGKVIVVNGFSKEFAMTGWRLGYTVASKKFTDLMVRFAENTVTCPTSFVQKAAVTALTAPRDWFRNMLDEYHARRDLMIEEVKKISGWQTNVPEGAFYCFPRTNFKNSRTFEKTLLEKKRVSLVAGAHFGLNGERHVRLSYTTSRDNIRQGMNLLRQYVDEHSD